MILLLKKRLNSNLSNKKSGTFLILLEKKCLTKLNRSLSIFLIIILRLSVQSGMIKFDQKVSKEEAERLRRFLTSVIY